MHPAYQALTIHFSTSAAKHPLRAGRSKQILPQQLTFEHTSGDYFVVKAEHIGDFGALSMMFILLNLELEQMGR